MTGLSLQTSNCHTLTGICLCDVNFFMSYNVLTAPTTFEPSSSVTAAKIWICVMRATDVLLFHQIDSRDSVFVVI